MLPSSGYTTLNTVKFILVFSLVRPEEGSIGKEKTCSLPLTYNHVIATSGTNNANPAIKRPAFAQLHGIRTNEKQRCKLHYYVKLVDSLLMNSGYD